MRMLMEPQAGIVQSEDDWRETWKTSEPELWGVPKFEDLELVEVRQDEQGRWVEKVCLRTGRRRGGPGGPGADR